MDRLFAWNALLPYLASALIIVAAAELGHTLGVACRRRWPGSSAAELSTLQSAVLGLMALVVGFTFSMSLSRYDARLSAGVQEANAISTTALRAEMLPEQNAREVEALLHEYVALRIDLEARAPDPELDRRSIDRSNEIRSAIWGHAVVVSRDTPRSVPVGNFVVSLNEMIDLQDIRLAAARNRIPTATVVMLYAISFFALGLSGFVNGLGTARARVPLALAAVLVAVIIAMVGDFDRPRVGLIRVSHSALTDLNESFAGR